MTIRLILDKKKRIANTILLLGLALGVFGSIIKPDKFPLFPLVGFLIPFFVFGLLFFKMKCPNCKNNIGYVVMYYGGPFALSKKVKFCPFCGVDIDKELMDQREV